MGWEVLAEQLTGRHAGMVFIADDLAAWLIGVLADAGRKKLTTLVLGDDQERALRSAATAAIQHTADELRPGNTEQAENLARVFSQVFGEPRPASLAERATVLEALQAAIARQLAPLDDRSLTGTGQSSADLLGVSASVLADKLTGHLVREIVIRGVHGGPLAPLAAQLNHDKTHLQGQRLEDLLGRIDNDVREALARLDLDQAFTLSCDIDPLDGSGRADFGGDVGIVYLGGFKFQLTLGNAGDRPIVIRSMKIDMRSYDMAALAQGRPERGYGQALVGHQLFVDLSRDSYNGWWMLSEGARLSSTPRPISSMLKDVFESPGSPRISFSLGPGESELIDGAFVAREPGLYEIKILALAVDAAQNRAASSTSTIRLCYLKEVMGG